MENLTLTLTFESPYTATGEPRADLPTGEVLAWDGDIWKVGFLRVDPVKWGSKKKHIVCTDNITNYIIVRWFAPLPTIIEDESTIF